MSGLSWPQRGPWWTARHCLPHQLSLVRQAQLQLGGDPVGNVWRGRQVVAAAAAALRRVRTGTWTPSSSSMRRVGDGAGTGEDGGAKARLQA